MSLPSHLFASSVDGALYDTRDPDWSKRAPLRSIYETHGRKLESLGAIKAALRAGQWTDLGGYPLYFVMGDGGAASFAGVRREWREVVRAYLSGDRNSADWRPVALEVNYEDSDLICDVTGERIPSAYAEDEEVTP